MIIRELKRAWQLARCGLPNLRGMWLLSKDRWHLKEIGWFVSFRTRMAIDRNGDPIPWLPYSVIAFLETRINPSLAVFEYGSGNSTLWWSERVARVVACEHNLKWHDSMLTRLPDNCAYLYRELTPNGDYAHAASVTGEKFDILVIDGVDRVNCARNSLTSLKPGGIIVWDNTERKSDVFDRRWMVANGFVDLGLSDKDRVELHSCFDWLKGQGFKRIDFTSLGPINTFAWCTTIFYRLDNCLGL